MATALRTRPRGVRGYVCGKLHVSKVATPRQAAADVVKALVGVGPDSKSVTTALALEWIGRALGTRDGEKAAVYLSEAVATCSGTLTVPTIIPMLTALAE